MKTSLNILATLFILVLFGRCNTSANLTPITNDGKNTFSCKVNGRVWVPDGRGGLFVTLKPIEGGFFWNSLTKSINIGIITYMSNGEEVNIYLRTLELGRHNLNKATKRQSESFDPEDYGWFHSKDNRNYMTSDVHTGSLTLVKADTASGVISGTFEFTASDGNGGVVKITKGRFDVNSKTL